MKLLKTPDGSYYDPADNPGLGLNWKVHGPNGADKYEVRHAQQILAVRDTREEATAVLDDLVKIVADEVLEVPNPQS